MRRLASGVCPPSRIRNSLDAMAVCERGGLLIWRDAADAMPPGAARLGIETMMSIGGALTRLDELSAQRRRRKSPLGSRVRGAMASDRIVVSRAYDRPGLGRVPVMKLAVSLVLLEGTLLSVFTPFFTTKATGHGLGLAAVEGIVRGHPGVLRVDTAVGRGSRFAEWFQIAGGVS